MFAEEVAVVEKKIQSYAARMSALETGVAEARRGLAALEKAQEASAQKLAKYLQELTVIQKRVFGALLAEVGAESVQQLESEVLTRQRERERVQSECRTHIALIEGKQQYGHARVEAIEAQLAELRATEAKNAQKAREVEARLAEEVKVAAKKRRTALKSKAESAPEELRFERVAGEEAVAEVHALFGQMFLRQPGAKMEVHLSDVKARTKNLVAWFSSFAPAQQQCVLFFFLLLSSFQ